MPLRNDIANRVAAFQRLAVALADETFYAQWEALETSVVAEATRAFNVACNTEDFHRSIMSHEVHSSQWIMSEVDFDTLILHPKVEIEDTKHIMVRFEETITHHKVKIVARVSIEATIPREYHETLKAIGRVKVEVEPARTYSVLQCGVEL